MARLLTAPSLTTASLENSEKRALRQLRGAIADIARAFHSIASSRSFHSNSDHKG
jgi:hypothetical protein